MTRCFRSLFWLAPALALAVALPAAAQQITVKTVAGGGPNHIPATAASLNYPVSGATDAAGNYLFADAQHVYKVDAKGVITIVAGNGSSIDCVDDGVTCVDNGDGGAATAATLNEITALALDAAGDIYAVDTGAGVVRRIDAATGAISTVAGDGTLGFAGDGGSALKAELQDPVGLAIDGSGDIFIADTAGRVREVMAATGIITTIAGGGGSTQALAYAYKAPVALALDPAGKNLYVADYIDGNITEINLSNGNDTVIAGGGSGAAAAGVAATAPAFTGIDALFVDGAGDLFFGADTSSGQAVWEIKAGGKTLTAAAAAGNLGSYKLEDIRGIFVDASGNLDLADSVAGRVYQIPSGGTAAVLAGNGNCCNSFVHAAASDPTYTALDTAINATGVWPDGSGNLWLSVENNVGGVDEVTADGNIHSVASNTGAGAKLNDPEDVVENAAGDLFVGDGGGCAVEEITPGGSVSLYAGTGTCGYSGDGGPAASAEINGAYGLAIDSAGNVYIADSSNYRVRRVDATTGVISTVAGNGTYGFSGDGGAATGAELKGPNAIAVDASGNLYLADSDGGVDDEGDGGNVKGRIREVNAKTGVITTVAGCGCGTPGAGDGGAATAATLTYTDGVAVDGAGNIYIADAFASRIREVLAATGQIETLAGTGKFDYAGEGGAAAKADIGEPQEMRFDGSGNLFVVENQSDRVLEIVNAAGLPVPAPASLSFSAQATGSTSAAETVTLTNPGLAADAIAGITAAGDFAETNTCGASLAAGASCTVAVTFKPTATGTRTGTLAVQTNIVTNAVTVALSGTGAAPATATPSAMALTFAAQATGTTSTAQAVTLTNSGGVALAINSIAITGPFAQTNTCGSSVAAGKTCSIAVTFAPAATGAAAGTLTVNDSAADSPQAIALSGAGVLTQLTLSPSALPFGGELSGSTSAAQTITVSNAGSTAIPVTGIAAGGDFAETNTCGSAVAAGGKCTVSVTFTPTATGSRTGTLSVSFTGSGSPATAALSGTGTDMAVAAASGSATSASVTAGGATSYRLLFTPLASASGTFNLTCTGAPQGATCAPVPNSFALGSTAVPVTVNVTTQARSGGFIALPRPQAPAGGWPALDGLLAALGLGLLGAGWCVLAGRPRERRWLAAAAGVGALSLMVACGGSNPILGPSQPTSAPTGTPAGTYTLTLTASGATGSRSQQLTLTVN